MVVPKRGDVISRVFYARVTKTFKRRDGEPEVICRDLTSGQQYNIRGRGVLELFVSANRFSLERFVSRSQLATLLTTAGATPFFIVYVKKGGAKRALTGRFLSTDSLLGRSIILDLDSTGAEKDRLRTVDHRTIREIVIHDTRYRRKK